MNSDSDIRWCMRNEDGCGRIHSLRRWGCGRKDKNDKKDKKRHDEVRRRDHTRITYVPWLLGIITTQKKVGLKCL